MSTDFSLRVLLCRIYLIKIRFIAGFQTDSLINLLIIFSHVMIRSWGVLLNCVYESKKETHTLVTNTQERISTFPLQIIEKHSLLNAVNYPSLFANGSPLQRGEFFKPLLHNQQKFKSPPMRTRCVSHSSSMTAYC